MGWNDNNAWTKAVLASDMTAAEKLVLIALSTFADYKTGRNARPKRADLAASLNVSEKTVQRGLDHGLKIGLVTIQTPPHRGKYVTVYAIVPPKHEDTGVLMSDRDEDTGVLNMRTQESSDMRTQESSVPLHLPSQDLITLSPEQALVRDLLGLDDERDEMLMKIPKVLQDNKVRNPKVWLRRCHENGDLLGLLQAETETAGWGKPEDDGLMTNPNPPPEGWGIPKKRVPVESVYRPLMDRVCGATDEEIEHAVKASREACPTWSTEAVWRDAYTTLQHDLVCQACGRPAGKHYDTCRRVSDAA